MAGRGKRAAKMADVRAADRQKLERTMCHLVDYEGVIVEALGKRGNQYHSLSQVIDALRLVVDGE